MGLEIQSEIFKWLQNLRIVKEGKRTQTSAVELSEQATGKFFDGLYISVIVKIILRNRNDEEAALKLDSIKENSTPAIRLYNWNLITEALKKLGYTVDYSLKSRLLNLENEAMQSILNFLFTLKPEGHAEDVKKKLQVQTSEVNKKGLKEAINIFEFLVISIGKHFKLSVQHTLNLFLDSNKYLAHLLVKGVKNSYEPVLLLLGDITQHMHFIVDSLFCIDEQQSTTFFMNALKPCLISKEIEVADKCLDMLKDLYQVYLQKGANSKYATEWMQTEGISTLFFSVKRHPSLFHKTITLAYAFIEERLFLHIQPAEKSLLWNSETEKITFYKDFIMDGHPEMLGRFIQSPVFDDWNRYCLKVMKKAKSGQEMCDLISIYQELWTHHLIIFEVNQQNLPSAFMGFLKTCAMAESELVFVEATRTLFHLLIFLGEAKNGNAPVLFKNIITALNFQDKIDRIQFFTQNFLQAFKQLPSLPGNPLVPSLLKFLETTSSPSAIQLTKLVLSDSRLKEADAEDLLQSLAKIFFYDVQNGLMAIDAMIIYLKVPGREQLIDHYCKACLSHFYSLGKDLHRPLSDLKSDYQRYRQQQAMRKGEASFLRNIIKYLLLNNVFVFLQRILFVSATYKQEAEAIIFHTYIKIKRELRKEYISRLLLPILKSFREDEELDEKIREYEDEFLHQSSESTPNIIMSDQNSESIEVTPLKRSKKSSRVNETLKTEENSGKKGIEAVMRELQNLKKKKELERQRSVIEQKEKDMAEGKKQLYRSMVNQKRIVEFGKKHQADVDYKNLHEFDSQKQQSNLVGLPNVTTFSIYQQEQDAFVQDYDSLMKKYRKIWRYLFFKYSSLSGSLKKTQMQLEEKINIAEIWKMLKEHDFDIIRKEESHFLVKKINESMKRRNDLQNLTYLGFEEYLLQMCHFAYGRAGYAHVPPSRQLVMFLEQVKQVTGSKGGSTEIFENPDEVYVQETDVIREFNRRLKDNPDYVLPEGYKKIKQNELLYFYQTSDQLKKKIKPSYCEVMEVLDEILWENLKFHILEPTTDRVEKCLARPALFQKMKEKLKDYSGGYLLPKRSLNASMVDKQPSPLKIEFHPLVNFSLGIKLGLAGVDVKLRSIADEVAYWLDDALDAVEAGKLRVANKAKIRIQNDLIRRKKSSAVQIRLEKIELEKRERMRAETVKHDAEKYRESKQEQQANRKRQEKLQRQERKDRQDRQMKKKLQEFEQAKNKLQAKRKQAQDKKEAQMFGKKKEKEEYKKNVEEYFKKKKEELEEKEKGIKANKQYQLKKEAENKVKEADKKKRLEIEVFKKEEEVLQKIVETKQSYQQVWKNPDIQKELEYYRSRIKLFFDLLLKYEKSKVSSTGQGEIGLNTLNFFALRTLMIPILVNKNILNLLFKNAIKHPKESRLGLNFMQFEEFLFKIAVKAKETLNGKRKNYEADLEESQLPTLKSSPEMDRRTKSLTDDYALDANGVRAETYRKLMEFIDIPIDKQDAEQRFREMLQNKSSQPLSMIMKEAKSYIDSTSG